MESDKDARRRVFLYNELDRHVAFYTKTVHDSIDWLADSFYKKIGKLAHLKQVPRHFHEKSSTEPFIYSYDGDIGDIDAVEKCIGLTEMTNEVKRTFTAMCNRETADRWNAVYFKIDRDPTATVFIGTLCFYIQTTDDRLSEVIDILTSMKGKDDQVVEEGVRNAIVSLCQVTK